MKNHLKKTLAYFILIAEVFFILSIFYALGVHYYRTGELAFQVIFNGVVFIKIVFAIIIIYFLIDYIKLLKK